MSAGLAPAGMAASLAAPNPTAPVMMKDQRHDNVSISQELKTATIVAIPNNNKLLRMRIAGGWFVGPEGQ